MELVEDVKALLVETAKSLKGSARRLFLARTVRADGEKGVNAWQNKSWDGIVGQSVKASANWSAGSSVSMHFRRGAVSAVKRICPTCLPISLPLWMVRAKRTRSFAPHVCIHG